ncbi:TIGR02117 family protein [Niabella ginsengisoli]|uniref:TIGR02117 family protein n=1 Tax=Niabella ginsengisoli TaxID=522298 RepID=A0ABS9SFK6_9BACT|nr:TIGR02117 family protein [Niabella ginsengisoli]MCH5596959.1 TIGR02117 family protein [Niabella ginsengisoli]
MKKLLKLLGKMLLYILAFLVLYVIAALLIPHIPVNKNKDYKSPNDVTIFIKTNGVHADIVVPVRNEWMDWTKYVKYEDTDLKDSTYSYVGMGWGDKGFYLQTPTWADLKFSVAFKAMTGLSSSAIHATFYKMVTPDASTVALHISQEDYTELVKYIINSFDINKEGNPIQIPSVDDGYGNMDAFYEAKGSYNLFRTCNSWANRALKAGHQKAAFWALRDKDIFRHYEK